MALTDIVLRELYKRAKRGENVAMKSDGGGLTIEAGRYCNSLSTLPATGACS